VASSVSLFYPPQRFQLNIHCRNAGIIRLEATSSRLRGPIICYPRNFGDGVGWLDQIHVWQAARRDGPPKISS
jgi:hypothetical protein